MEKKINNTPALDKGPAPVALPTHIYEHEKGQWDVVVPILSYSAKRYGVQFRGGLAVTDNAKLAEQFRCCGFSVTKTKPAENKE